MHAAKKQGRACGANDYHTTKKLHARLFRCRGILQETKGYSFIHSKDQDSIRMKSFKAAPSGLPAFAGALVFLFLTFAGLVFYQSTAEPSPSSFFFAAVRTLVVFLVGAAPLAFLLCSFIRKSRSQTAAQSGKKAELEALYRAQARKLDETLETLGESRLRLEMVFSVFQNTLEGLLVFDQHHSIVDANASVSRITGWNQDSLLKQPVDSVLRSQELRLIQSGVKKSLQNEAWEGEAIARSKDGREFPIWLRVAALSGAFEQPYYIASFHDITESKDREEQIRHMALHDALTGLPNRNFLQHHLEQALSTPGGREHMAIIYFDLDGFKRVNDNLGHDAGDQVLRMVGERLLQKLRAHDVIVRMGGDEFVIVCQRIRGKEQAAEVAQRLLDGLREPFAVAGTECSIGASLGIAMPPEGGLTAEELLKNADMAMYAAKGMGKNCFCFFSDSLQAESQQRSSLESRLTAAVAGDNFEVYFQPIISFDGCTVLGVEALARWKSGDESAPSPRSFIRLAEETGLIMPLSEQIIRKAFEGFIPLLKEQANLYLALNISPALIRNDQLMTVLESSLSAHKLTPRCIVLEITESAFENQRGHLQEALRRFTDKGYRIAVDNFGSVYNSFSYLRNLPIAFLKVDGTYVREMSANPDSASLVKGVRGMGEWIGAIVVAEGVETDEQSERIRALGYEFGQGYLYCGPGNAQSTLEYLRAAKDASSAAPVDVPQAKPSDRSDDGKPEARSRPIPDLAN